jgi:uncharacterized protein (DUF1499 family)
MGMENSVNRLAPCPDRPNCVSTLGKSKRHFIEPYRYTVDFNEAKSALKTAVSRLERVKLVREEQAYLHYEFKSLIFRFIDDVEFYFDNSSGTVHFRSASRAGHSDLGVNRRRMEKIRTQLEEMFRPDSDLI